MRTNFEANFVLKYKYIKTLAHSLKNDIFDFH